MGTYIAAKGMILGKDQCEAEYVGRCSRRSLSVEATMVALAERQASKEEVEELWDLKL